MPYSRGIEGFITKRAAIYVCVLSTADILFVEKRWHALLGIIIGGIFGILKFYSLSAVVNGILNKTSIAVKSIIGYVINFIVMIFLMASSLMFDLWFGAGMIVGILTVPMVIITNNITEGFGITHNNYGQERRCPNG